MFAGLIKSNAPDTLVCPEHGTCAGREKLRLIVRGVDMPGDCSEDMLYLRLQTICR